VCSISVMLLCLPAGVLQALSFVFKLGQRARLLPHAACVWEILAPICGAGGANEGPPEQGVPCVLVCVFVSVGVYVCVCMYV